jgi:phosphatidylglycerophosphate synthase
MFRSLNLHRTGRQADWEKITAAEQNPWQRLAAATHGLLTPANLISLTGATMTLAGLIRITDDLNWTNVMLILVGRLADIADGYAAEKTGTKSPLGEIVDVGVDKILALAAAVTLAAAELLPVPIIAWVLFYSVFNTVISLTAKLKRITLHPSLEGKLAGLTCWATIGFYLLYRLTGTDYRTLSRAVLIFSLISLAAFVGYGLISMRDYYLLLRKKDGS